MGELATEGLKLLLHDYGVTGVVIALLLIAVGVLWRRNEKLQDQRVADARELTEVVINNTHTLNGLSELIKAKR